MRGKFEWKDTEMLIKKDQISLDQCFIKHRNQKTTDYVCVRCTILEKLIETRKQKSYQMDGTKT